MIYTKNLSEPWFSLIKLGLKTCEGRLNKGDFAAMKKGDHVIFENNELGFRRTCKVKITSVHKYPSFIAYLEKEKLLKCLPGIDTIEEGLQVYYKYFTKADEHTYKIVATRVKIIH